MTAATRPTILVTGGTGFIGRSLIGDLARDHRITVLSRARTPLGPEIDVIGRLDELDGPPDIVINLAGETIAQRWSTAALARIRDSRIELTEQLVNALRTHPPRLMISASAIGRYGVSDPQPWTEDRPIAPCTIAPIAQQLCAEWEQAALALPCPRTVLLRTGVVLARDGGTLKQLLPPFRLGLGGPIGNGRQWFSWIDRADAVAAIRHIIATPALSGPVNLTAPAPVSGRELAATLGRVLRRPAILPVPAPILRLIFGSMAQEIMLHGQQVHPARLLEHGFSFTRPTLEECLRAALS